MLEISVRRCSFAFGVPEGDVAKISGYLHASEQITEAADRTWMFDDRIHGEIEWIAVLPGKYRDWKKHEQFADIFAAWGGGGRCLKHWMTSAGVRTTRDGSRERHSTGRRSPGSVNRSSAAPVEVAAAGGGGGGGGGAAAATIAEAPPEPPAGSSGGGIPTPSWIAFNSSSPAVARL